MSRRERLDRLLVVLLCLALHGSLRRSWIEKLRLETLARWHVAPTSAAAIDLADPHALGVVPGIGRSLVGRVAHASDFIGPIDSADDLLGIPGMGEDVAARVGRFVKNPRHDRTIDAPSSR